MIAAVDIDTHMQRVRQVLTRLSDAGLRIKFEKCEFFKREVKYLGYKISEKGMQPLEDKLECVRKAPIPQDVSHLRSFLGSINYYACYIHRAAEKLYPLYCCLEKDNFLWTEECTTAFEQIKKELTGDAILIHFDPDKLLVLTCDASPYGVSAVLSHPDENNIDRPICFASRTLKTVEKGYSHLDKKASAIIFGIKKFTNIFTVKSFSSRQIMQR